MEAEISIFDPTTHVYSYFHGRVVPLDMAAQPLWVSEEVTPYGTLRSAPYSARDEAEATEHAEKRRSVHAKSLTVVRVR